MNIIKLIKIAIISIFLLHLAVSVAAGNDNFSKKNIEYARSIFKQIEKGNWQNAIRKSKKINNKMLEQLVYWYISIKKQTMQISTIIKILLIKILISQRSII